MKTRAFAAKYIRFDKTSPVTGPFRLPNYRFLGAPMDSSDDIRVKRLVIYKASSCLGTVLGQIINAKRIARDVGDQIMVCQTNDDAEKWTKTRGKEWLESIPDVVRLLKNDKYAQTNSLWLFRHKFLIITGPGINAAQSDQVRYVQTDESHLDEFAPGRLAEFEKRMGARWDRQGTHITTAANAGKEVDQFYYQATQNEWHWCCPKCHKLIWPLWEKDATDYYNGEKVFRWTDHQSDTATLESIRAFCPHCGFERLDTSRDRFSLQEGADYVSMNPNAPIEFASYRWSAFAAAHWMPFRDLLAEYLIAIKAATRGDLKPHEDFEKKRLCKSYEPHMPDSGEGQGSDNSAFWISQRSLYPEQLRMCSFDVQDDQGFHLWAQCDEFLRNGDSQRIDYQKLTSWPEARAFFQDHQTKAFNVAIDAGHRMREVYSRCEEWGCYAFFADDDDEWPHEKPDPRGKQYPPIRFMLPYSERTMEDAMVGKPGKRVPRHRNIPAGHCLARRWAKYVFGGYLMALKSGKSNYYGIPKDINPDYVAQLNSHTYVRDLNKKFGTTEMILKQVRKDDHSFSTSSMNLVLATIRNFFPLSNQQPQENSA